MTEAEPSAHLFLAPAHGLPAALVSECERLLGPQERERLARYRGRRRREYLLGRALLRWALSQVVDPARTPADWELYERTDLPPRVPAAEAAGWSLSLAHSHGRDRTRAVAPGLVAVVLSPAGACGVDVEFCRPDRDWSGLADGWFHPREVAALQALTAAGRGDYFYSRWALKEAWLKSRQLGLFSGAMSGVWFEPGPATGALQSWVTATGSDAVGGGGDTYSLGLMLAAPLSVTGHFGPPLSPGRELVLSWQSFVSYQD